MSDKPVVVGVDGSADSKRALEWAFEYARQFGAPLHTLVAWHAPITFRYPTSLTSVDDAGLKAEARSALDETVGSVLGDDAHVTKLVERGHPAEALVEAATTAQLLVVGSRGRGAFLGMLIGSVSQYCSQHAACPVVVIRHRGDE